MSKTEQINVRMEAQVKKGAEAVFRELGISPTQAISLFYRQVSLQKGLPFEVRIPNKETVTAIRNVREERGLAYYQRFAEVRKKLGI